MWDHFIGRQIRRANRNLLWTNGLLVLLVLGVAFFARVYLYNFFFGPFPLDHQSLLAMKNPEDAGIRYFVTVDSDRMAFIGQDLKRSIDKNTKEVKNTTVTAELAVIVIKDENNGKDRLLCVRVPQGSSSAQLDGAIIPMAPDMVGHLVVPFENRNPEWRGKTFPGFMLDATGFRTPGYWGGGIGAPILLFGLWNVFRGFRRAMNPERHPLVNSLIKHGPPADVAQLIHEEVEQESPNVPLHLTVITRSWLLKPSYFGLRIVPLNDVVWIYKKVTKHSTNGVPTGTSYAAVISQSDGASLEIAGTETSSSELLQKIHGSVPWILVGFDPELAGLYQKKRDVVLDIVEQRRQAILKGETGPAAEPPQEQ